MPAEERDVDWSTTSLTSYDWSTRLVGRFVRTRGYGFEQVRQDILCGQIVDGFFYPRGLEKLFSSDYLYDDLNEAHQLQNRVKSALKAK